MDDIPFDVSWSFDEEGRDVPNDAGQMRQAVRWLRERADEAADEAERARLLGWAGGYARMLGDLSMSVAVLSEAIRGADRVGAVRLSVRLRIRLAHAHQWAGTFDKSNQVFEQLLVATAEDPTLADLRDFVHQHHGKNLADQCRTGEAVAHLEEALRLRREKGDEALIASTELALAEARRRSGAP
jgi:tetratricopeptide (TPR) repeat protein